MAEASLDRVRELCRRLPECEIDGDQHHRISVRDKTVAWHTVDHHGDGRVALTLKVPKGENAALVESDPQRFFLPPYVAHHGYVGVYLDTGRVDWDEVGEMLTDAYRLTAPKSLSKHLHG